MKTICFDFDGVFHTYEHGWTWATDIPDPPVDLEQMKEELCDLSFGYQYRIVILSTRCSTLDGKTAVWKWLEKYDLDIYVDEITSEKPPAVVYVDDRGLTFNGDWHGLADKIAKFESWTERRKNESCSN